MSVPCGIVCMVMCSISDNAKSYVLGNPDDGTCPAGSVHVVEESECDEASKMALPPGTVQGRTTMVKGSFGWVWPDCTVQSGSMGDWATVYNEIEKGNGKSADGKYTYSPVCRRSSMSKN